MVEGSIQGGSAHALVPTPHELQQLLGVEVPLSAEDGLQDRLALGDEPQVPAPQVLPKTVDWTALTLR